MTIKNPAVINCLENLAAREKQANYHHEGTHLPCKPQALRAGEEHEEVDK